MATYRGPSSKKTETTNAPRPYAGSAGTGATSGSFVRRKFYTQTGDAEPTIVIGKPRDQVDVFERLMGHPGDTVTEAMQEYAKLRERDDRGGKLSVAPFVRFRTPGTQTLSFVNVYKAAPQDRIGVVKSGIAPSMVGEIAAGLSTTAGFVIGLLGLKRSTITRKQADADAKLSPEDSEKLVGLARLAGQVEVMVKESGNLSGFDSGKWLIEWLNEPIAALGGQKPAQYMDTNEGQAVVSNLLLQVQYGVYA